MENQKAVGYVRVSTTDQAENGVSLAAQKAKIKVWAEANQYTLIAIYVDAGISGFRATNRPGLQEALSAACTCNAALVVYSLSRLARSTKDALSISERLDRAGADLVSLSEKIDTTSAAGKMVFRMLAVLAEFERDLISERTVAAMSHKKRHMERVGTVPLGFDLAGERLIPNVEEQAVLTRLRVFRVVMGLSYQQTAARLNAEKLRTKNGRRWWASTVRYISLNNLYANGHPSKPVLV